MIRIPAIDPATATGPVKTMLDAVQRSLGVTPNLFRTAARSPSALEALTRAAPGTLRLAHERLT